MKYTNINIQDGSRRFKYIIEYQDDTEYSNYDQLGYLVGLENNPLRVDFMDTGDRGYAGAGTYRHDNIWSTTNLSTTRQYIPSSYNLSSVNLYFPTNSVEAFTNNNLYALTVNTWIHGHTVYLGTYIVNRKDAIACKKETKFLNTRYFEYINIKFIDPWYLTYSEEWKEFRQEVCGEAKGYTELNNTGSVLNFTLYPVVWNEDHYIKLDPYIGGQNAINISDSVSDYIGCGIELTQSNTSFDKIVNASITFNRDYSTGDIQTFEDLKLYMLETYDVDEEIHLRYNLMVVDNENVYKVISKNLDEINCDFTRDEIRFDTWDGWKEGLRFFLTVDILAIDEEIMLLRSNTISLTQDNMKYFIGTNPGNINYINTTLLDMNNYTVNAVNKVEKKIIKLERPNDTKANLIKPVYYRVRDLENLIVHPSVTENICINLDAYKSTVETFYLKIEGVNFVETARTNTGVIFKIIGANLAGEVGSGTYYVLNQDKELITTGKYTYDN